MRIADFKDKKIHFIGIGGISMRGLAQLLLMDGYEVTGSDMSYSECFDDLEKMGAKCYTPHKAGQEEGAGLIVINSAISKDNPELQAAREKGVPVMERTELLSQLMENARIAFGVSGMHGKTTCSSMLVTILELCGKDPTAHLGGELDLIGGATKHGGDIFITEACEYKNNYHRLSLTGAAILNIDEDHLDFFEDLDDIIDSYRTYINKLPADGVVVLNADDENTLIAAKSRSCKAITFGIENDADFKAVNLKKGSSGCWDFDLLRNGVEHHVSLSAPGRHNVYNACAAIASAFVCECDIQCACKAVGEYKGAKRRFEKSGQLKNGAEVFHDYAHHPREVKATLSAAKDRTTGKVIAVFQPHTYTRTRALLDDFAAAFGNADELIITDIYAARELDDGSVHSKDLVKKVIQENPGERCFYADSFEEAAAKALELSDKDDIIITLGAGDIQKVNRILKDYE
ncbi:MAG: UDP-N-acetylmuramate--L-alanine ligase [Clostridia bacterium]|nr:UDP-N-acetylmuramate--L-alanine ligase [Clostridia bacterium]